MISITGKQEKSTMKVTLKVNGDDWTKPISKAEQNFLNNLEVKGFRKGKVPIEQAKTYINSEKLRSDVLGNIIEENSEKIWDELKKADVITHPSFHLVKISDEELEVEFVSSLKPTITLGNIKNIKTKLNVEKPTAKEIQEDFDKKDATLKITRERKATEGTIKGDTINIDYDGKIDKKSFEHGDGKDFDLELGSDTFIKGFEEEIIKKSPKKGDKLKVKTKFNKNYPSEEVAGKEAEFDVVINKITYKEDLKGEDLKKNLQKRFRVDSKDELKKKGQQILTAQKESEAKEKFFTDFIEEVKKLKDTKLPIPQELISQEIDEEYEKFSEQITQQGLKIEDYLKMLELDQKSFKEKNLKPMVEKKISDGLIYSQLIVDLKIEISDEEYEAKLDLIAKSQKMDIEKLKKQPGVEYLRNEMIYEKLIATLLKK